MKDNINFETVPVRLNFRAVVTDDDDEIIYRVVKHSDLEYELTDSVKGYALQEVIDKMYAQLRLNILYEYEDEHSPSIIELGHDFARRIGSDLMEQDYLHIYITHMMSKNMLLAEFVWYLPEHRDI